MLMRTGFEDREAFQAVYRMTSAKLFGICLRICGDRPAAEDVLQEVYLLVWKRAGAWEPGRSSPITWLAAIARNRAIDWRRAQAVRPTVSDDLIQEFADPAVSAEDRLMGKEEANRLHTCLGLLDVRQSTAIRTAFFNGLTYAELADHQNVPLGTMKSWVRRGLS
jgi:RNA polymerase sigma factor (sigma-70 family)